MRRIVVAVDPGGSHTGIVVRSGADLHAHALVDRNRLEATIDPYLHEVCDEVTRARDLARNLVINAGDGGAQMVLAVEDVVDPTPHLGIIAVRGLLDTAQILGGLAAKWPITRVPPSGHGLSPLVAYPAELVGDLEEKGGGKLRHCRAAWDIAHHANTLLTLGAGR